MSTVIFRLAVICSTVALCVPVADAALVPLSDIVMVKGGISYSLALKSDGTVLAWGDNSAGELGDGTSDTRLTPVHVVCGAAAGDIDHCSPDGHLKGVSQIAAGGGISLALLDNRAVMAWGANTRFTDGSTNSTTPVYVPCGVASGADCSGGLLTNALQISAGFSHSLVLLNDGTVLAWGTNNNGNLGNSPQGVPSPSTTPVQVSGFGSGSGVTAIAAGNSVSLALKFNGTVMAWGGTGGRIGDGMGGSRNAPVNVCAVGTTSCSVASGNVLQGVSAIAESGSNSYAILTDGTLLVWGNNDSGQLGNGTTATNSRVPVNVCAVGAQPPCSVVNGNILQGVSRIVDSSQSNSSYAIESDGTLLAWGNNANGQLGDGTTTQRNTPVQVSGLGSRSGVTAVAAGDLHALVLKSDGTVLSWGNNSSGQLGNGGIFAQATPVQTSGLGSGSGVTAVAAGDQFSLALRSDGTVLAWGRNTSGQLGDGMNTNSNVPVQVVCRAGDTPGSTFCSSAGVLQGVAAIAAAASSSLALMKDGTLLGWGDNGNGQLGDGTTTQRNTPVNVCVMGAKPTCSIANGNVLQGVSAIATLGLASLALISDGTVLAWGNDAGGYLGDGDLTKMQKNTPVNVCGVGAMSPCSIANGNALQGVSAIAAAGNHAFALTNNNTVLAWGENLADQLGDGTTTSENTPVNVCAVGATATCSIANGNVLQGVLAIASGDGGGFALVTVGSTTTLLAWGLNGSGQVGDGTTTFRNTPVNVCAAGATPPCSVLNDILGVSAMSGGGGNSTYAIMSDQAVLAWGSNNSGQLGDGTFSGRLTPVQVSGLGSGSGVRAISGGGSFSVALKSDGAVLAWGADDVGELGDGAVYTATFTPSQVLFDDTTPPTLSFGAPSPPVPNGANGWYITSVSIPWTAVDADSGLDATRNPTSPLVLAGEGFAVSGSVTVCDIAGNCATFRSPNFMIDKTPPKVTVSVWPDVLWPPDHRNVAVTIKVTANDNLGLPLQPIANLTAASSEPDLAPETGNFPGDVNGQDGFSSPVVLTPGTFAFDTGSIKSGSATTTILLRAERTGSGPGRVYTIAGTVLDAAGNPTRFTTTVAVPLAQSSARLQP